MNVPKTQYAKSGEVSVAYQEFGEGPLDIVIVPGFVSHVELVWEFPPARHMMERLAAFARVIQFDKRGTGLSDPVIGAPTLEERMDDVRAIMDAVGSERAALIGFSEGGAMSILFGASHPDRTAALVLYAAMARTAWAEDYPIGTPKDALIQGTLEWIAPFADEGSFFEVMAPSAMVDPMAIQGFLRFQRYAATPSMLQQLYAMYIDVDVRAALPAVHAPTLVLHRRGDRAVNRRAGQYVADNIEGAKYVELPGQDHSIFAGDTEAVLDEVEEFLTGVRRGAMVDRVLATVMFTDIVGSTERAAELGDTRWRELLEAQIDVLRRELARFGGREVKQIGDGCLATFDGPARALRCGLAMTQAVKAIGVDIRVGLHTGEVEVMGSDVGGIAVHIASRINGLAEAGRVFCSGTVKDLVVGSGISFEDRGMHTLKGVPDEWRVLAVTP